jgi:hypothetical protein
MQVQGITWNAVILDADEFAAMKNLLVEVFGLTPEIDTQGWTMFPMSNGGFIDLYAPRSRSRLLRQRHRVRLPG